MMKTKEWRTQNSLKMSVQVTRGSREINTAGEETGRRSTRTSPKGRGPDGTGGSGPD
jgi:hypothetical protein